MAKTQKTNSQTESKKPNLLQGMVVVGFLIGIGLTSYCAGLRGIPGFPTKQSKPAIANVSSESKTLYEDYQLTQQSAKSVLSIEQANALTTVNSKRLEADLAQANFYLTHAQPVEAIWLLSAMRGYIKADHNFVQHRLAELASAKKAPSKPLLPVATAHANTPTTTNIPILLYHKTPADFEQQLLHLRDRGYTTVSMAQVACGLHKTCILPSKPAVITFDDGFSDQLKAFDLIKKYNMRATFYMIIGGDKSNHCIGIERTTGAPCGDSYLNWDETKMFSDSPLVEIGAHTVDHLALASLNVADQTFQMQESKRRLEEVLGKPITTLAYPYGSFTAVTAQIAQQLGFSSAVSTIPGSDQSMSTLYSLHRIRNTYTLP